MLPLANLHDFKTIRVFKGKEKDLDGTMPAFMGKWSRVLGSSGAVSCLDGVRS